MQQLMTHPNPKPQLLHTSIDSSYQLFLLDRKVQRLSPHTIRFYSTHLNPFTEWCRTEHQLEKLEDIASAHIRAYLLLLYERDLSSYSVHAVARSLRAFFNFCVQEGLIAVTPMAKIKMPKLDRTILPAFEDADIRKLLQACVETRERAIVLVLLDTGCRVSELINLNGGDVNVAQGVVTIRKGKGGKDRIVYLGNKSRKMLMRFYLERGQPGEKDPIWTNSRHGTRMTDSGLRQLLSRLGRRSGVKHCHPHTFRRTFALWSLRNGMSLYHLQRLMGHTDIAVLRQYLALVESDLQRSHDRYGAVDNMGGAT